jgi:hypothetical protein
MIIRKVAITTTMRMEMSWVMSSAEYHWELQNAQARIAQLEAQLEGNSRPRKQKHLVPLVHLHARDFITALQQQLLVFSRIGI